MTLSEFLLARFDEDEEKVAGVKAPFWVENTPLDPVRVRADLDAKRRIVEQWQVGANRRDDQGRPAHLFDPLASALLKSHAGWLRILAWVYSDHPDFDPEWRP